MQCCCLGGPDMIGLGRAFKLPVIAEGVETQGQATFLLGERCDEMQGFLIGRPAPIENYAEVVGSSDSSAGARSGQKQAV